eukprot:gene27101-biopygen17658
MLTLLVSNMGTEGFGETIFCDLQMR